MKTENKRPTKKNSKKENKKYPYRNKRPKKLTKVMSPVIEDLKKGNYVVLTKGKPLKFGEKELGCGKLVPKWNRYCGQMEDLKHSDHIIFCESCEKSKLEVLK